MRITFRYFWSTVTPLEMWVAAFSHVNFRRPSIKNVLAPYIAVHLFTCSCKSFYTKHIVSKIVNRLCLEQGRIWKDSAAAHNHHHQPYIPLTGEKHTSQASFMSYVWFTCICLIFQLQVEQLARARYISHAFKCNFLFRCSILFVW